MAKILLASLWNSSKSCNNWLYHSCPKNLLSL